MLMMSDQQKISRTRIGVVILTPNFFHTESPPKTNTAQKIKFPEINCIPNYDISL